MWIRRRGTKKTSGNVYKLSKVGDRNRDTKGNKGSIKSEVSIRGRKGNIETDVDLKYDHLPVLQGNTEKHRDRQTEPSSHLYHNSFKTCKIVYSRCEGTGNVHSIVQKGLNLEFRPTDFLSSSSGREIVWERTTPSTGFLSCPSVESSVSNS